MRTVLAFLTVLALAAPAASAQNAPWVPGPEFSAEGAYCPRPERHPNLGYALLGAAGLAAVALRRNRTAG